MTHPARGPARLTALSGGGAGPHETPPAPRILLFSDQELIAEGLRELLPESWRPVAEVSIGGPAPPYPPAPLDGAVIDAGAPGAAQVAAAARERGATVVMLLVELPAEPSSLYDDADAILPRDAVDARMLRLALAAGRLGLRVLPRELAIGQAAPGTSPARGPNGTPSAEGPHRVLALLAEGKRDAEIALELSLSESAVRKLIQRAVRRAGARTRAQAVAAAVRDGSLR